MNGKIEEGGREELLRRECDGGEGSSLSNE